MKKKYTVSVIIPTYKRVEKLKRAIDSVLNQTFTNWEIIVIDNHSSDGTKELIDNYNNPKIVYGLGNGEGDFERNMSKDMINKLKTLDEITKQNTNE